MGKIVAEKRIRTDSVIASILIVYIYLPYVWNILENALNVPSYTEYAIRLILLFLTIIVSKRVNKKVLIFLLSFVVVIIFNYILVSYKYYVIVEGIQAFLGIAIPCLCVSNTDFNLRFFLEKWYHFSIKNSILVILAVVLLKLGLVHYSIFTSICVPNAFILSYRMLQGEKRFKSVILVAGLNIVVAMLFGGRMAAVVSGCMLVLAFIYSRKIKIWKKIAFMLILILSAYFVLNYLEEILTWISNILGQYGFHSRSITLLITQLQSNELYVTGRDNIYSLCIEYIKGHLLFPGGFGIPLYITNGEYYYAHNLVLQLLIMFSLPGTIIGIMITFKRWITIKRHGQSTCLRLLSLMFVSYFLIGMTGSSIWIHCLSTIFIALLFFGKLNMEYRYDEEHNK